MTNGTSKSNESAESCDDSTTNDQQWQQKLLGISPVTSPQTGNRFWTEQWTPNSEEPFDEDEDNVDADGCYEDRPNFSDVVNDDR